MAMAKMHDMMIPVN